jgi:HK97 family phage portal protein
MSFFTKVMDLISKKANGVSTLNGYSFRDRVLMQELYGNGSEYFKLNDISLYVNRGIAKRAEKVGEVEFKLFNRKTGEEILENEWLTLLDKPNDHQTGDHFWKLVSMYRDISGFVVIRKKGNEAVFKENQKIKSLEVLNSMNVQINYDKDIITSFSHTRDGGEVETIKFDECIYWTNPNPMKQTEGVSLLKAGLYSLDTDNQLAKYQNAIVKNGGNLDTVFTFEQDLTEAEIKQAEDKFKEKKGDPRNSNIPFFVGGKTKVERLGLTPSELAYLESRKLYARDMTVITGVPLSILGLTSDETFANADMAYRVFLREVIKPIIKDLVNLLDWKLIPEEYDLGFVDPTPEDIVANIQKATAMYNLDVSTINERREILGLEPYEDEEADKIYVSYSKMPLGEDPYETTKEEEEIKSYRKSLNTSVVELFRNKGFRDMYRKIQNKKSDKREAIFMTAIRNYFNEQQERLIDEVKNQKSIVDNYLDYDVEVSIARGMSLPILRQFLIEAGKETADLYDNPRGFSMTGAIEKWLSKRVNIFSEQITDTTFKQLKEQFKESFDNGETRQQLIRRIEGVYDDFDENRAKTIARTEVHGATQKGNFESSKQSGATIKIWVSTLDDKTRDTHANLDGEEASVGRKFSNGLMFAGDPSGSPEETINCRCSTI